jgi:predicted nucleotidyltransferase
VRFEDVMAVLTALHEENVEYVLVGGVAIGLHGFERATSDIDLFVRTSPDNIERLRRALRRVFDDPSIDEITSDDLAGEYPTIRYGPPEADFMIDILGRLGTEIEFDDLDYELLALGGTTVRLATPRTLFRMKRGTVPIDRIDAEVLKAAFHLEDD